MENCLKTYTKVDTLTDFQCRKCTLVATLQKMTEELELLDGNDDEKALALNIDIGRIKDALQSNIEATLVRILGCNKGAFFVYLLINFFFV